MIAIVATYYNRQEQLTNTLHSFLQYDPKDFFVVIVDDGSPEDIILPKLPFEVVVIKMRGKTWTNPEPAYNAGIKYALSRGADIIVLQNAECMHVNNILHYAGAVTDKIYFSFGCYSQGKGEDPGSVINMKGSEFDGESAWYNHPKYRPVGYDFCSAITAANIIKLNGYDERFSDGVGYGDNYLLARIRMLGIMVYITEFPYVIHQWHYTTEYGEERFKALEKNRHLYNKLIQDRNPRAVHLITNDF
jgi:glycosyltransferase involved in cell wall biosynthesis